MRGVEENIEWEEVDKVFSIVNPKVMSSLADNLEGRYDEFFRSVPTTIANEVTRIAYRENRIAHRLPNMMSSAPIQEWLAKIERNIRDPLADIYSLSRAYASLYTLALASKDENGLGMPSGNINPLLSRVYFGFSDGPNRALAMICRNACNPYEGALRAEEVYSELAACIDRWYVVRFLGHPGG